MKKIKWQVFLFLALNLFNLTAFAWSHSIELGYSISHDPRHTKYNNSGFLLSGDLFPLRRTPWTFWSITGSLAQWHTTEPQDQTLTTGAVSLALRFYPLHAKKKYIPYLLGSVGPSILSHRQFGFNKQAKNMAFQTNLGLGMEVKKFDVNLRLQHISNASLAQPNHGFNILYLLSLGYLF